MTAKDINGICKKLGIRREDLFNAERKLDFAASEHFDELPEWSAYAHAQELLTNVEMRALALYHPGLQVAYPETFGAFAS
ncbi:hypothetical protein [Atopobium sp. oral taxon 810]|uniref:hypothetical protein n=1 Tax=Atopobium sp. oral taxon 810 TaxID=712158 RepID=UPI0003980020|nr:hypothetical protein [Atopobium sp. oral taxon 810]ERI04356.1 toxin-antitoxin system, toxin component domain protein [Atopobium sp. oral taxon 810 str. F0209]